MKLALAALLLASAPRQAPEPPCLTRSQLEAFALFALPPMLDALAAKCAPQLPPQAYLLNGGKALSQSLAAESDAHWSEAGAAMRIIAGDMPSGLGADTMRGLVRDMALSELKPKPDDCVQIDRMGELLAPLPPRNLAAVVVTLGELGLKGDDQKKKKPPFVICPGP